MPGAQLAPSANHLALGAGFDAPFLYAASADGAAADVAASALRRAAAKAGIRLPGRAIVALPREGVRYRARSALAADWLRFLWRVAR